MRLLYAGTPEFAAVTLRALIAAGYDIPLVLTQPDRPAGRGMLAQASPVKVVARAAGLPVHQPVNLKTADALAPIRAADADWMIVAAYGLILPQPVLDLPRYGCLNLHASLLPRWRGAAPIQRAILAGDAETGVCLMQMDAGLDTGPVYARGVTPIGADDTATSLHARLATLAAELLLAELPTLATRNPRPQPQTGATYAAKLDKGEAPLDWQRPAIELERQVRAFDPVPGATAVLAGQTLKVWAAAAGPGSGAEPPGTVLCADRVGIVVACGNGVLTLTELQKSGGRRQSAGAFLSGRPVVPGEVFASPARSAGP